MIHAFSKSKDWCKKRKQRQRWKCMESKKNFETGLVWPKWTSLRLIGKHATSAQNVSEQEPITIILYFSEPHQWVRTGTSFNFLQPWEKSIRLEQLPGWEEGRCKIVYILDSIYSKKNFHLKITYNAGLGRLMSWNKSGPRHKCHLQYTFITACCRNSHQSTLFLGFCFRSCRWGRWRSGIASCHLQNFICLLLDSHAVLHKEKSK